MRAGRGDQLFSFVKSMRAAVSGKKPRGRRREPRLLPPRSAIWVRTRRPRRRTWGPAAPGIPSTHRFRPPARGSGSRVSHLTVPRRERRCVWRRGGGDWEGGGRQAAGGWEAVAALPATATALPGRCKAAGLALSGAPGAADPACARCQPRNSQHPRSCVSTQDTTPPPGSWGRAVCPQLWDPQEPRTSAVTPARWLLCILPQPFAD